MSFGITGHQAHSLPGNENFTKRNNLGPRLVFRAVLSFILSLLFPERLHSCYIYFHCSYLYNYYNYIQTLCIKRWVLVFHTEIHDPSSECLFSKAISKCTDIQKLCISTSWFCFVFLKAIELSVKLPCLWGCFIPSFSGAWELICSVAHCKMPFIHTHRFIYMLYTQTGYDIKDNFIPPRK